MRTPKEIRDTEFDKVSRGYNIQDVDAFLSLIADQVETLMAEKDELQKKMMLLAEKVEEYRGEEDALRSALVSAERLKDNILQEAQEQKDIVMRDAQQKADKVIDEAQKGIEREEITLKALRQQVSAFKSEILGIYKSHLEVLSELPDEPVEPGLDDEAVSKLFTEEAAPQPAEPAPEQTADMYEQAGIQTQEYVAPEAMNNATGQYDGFAPREGAEPDAAPGPEFATFDTPQQEAPAQPEEAKESRFDNLDFGEDFTFGRD